jgi:hypothetical protein
MPWARFCATRCRVLWAYHRDSRTPSPPEEALLVDLRRVYPQWPNVVESARQWKWAFLDLLGSVARRGLKTMTHT